ncbi:unnamed protein product [Acanthosepion pharaonis]|uniref:Uncharacterized protein n=1 Tax=Acanthosepion pharaonis TaxID=158019 RepID=A0A812ARK9_ACAPH|nr:unnamed protein product [Sepia pharaonis]
MATWLPSPSCASSSSILYLNSAPASNVRLPHSWRQAAVSKLPLEAVQEVREIIISPPKDKPYYKLKAELHLAGEGTEDGIIRHIFLQRLPSAYRAVLAAVGEDASVKKLAKIADNVAGLTSGCTAPVSAVETQEPDPLARLLEGQRRLEARKKTVAEEQNCFKKLVTLTHHDEAPRLAFKFSLLIDGFDRTPSFTKTFSKCLLNIILKRWTQ